VFYKESCVWPDAILQWIRQRNSIKLCANVGKSVRQTLAMIRQAFGEESMSRKGKSEFTATKNGETGEEQLQEHAHHFL
jgi:hypothetical protein